MQNRSATPTVSLHSESSTTFVTPVDIPALDNNINNNNIDADNDDNIAHNKYRNDEIMHSDDKKANQNGNIECPFNDFGCTVKSSVDQVKHHIKESSRCTLAMIPFNKCTISKRFSVSEVLTPHVTPSNLAFLGRPRSERNAAFGLKRFVDLIDMEHDNSFVNDNTCFIAIHIDLCSIYNAI
ncbi:unnamed protein product [Anisakis simplex]|uniref:UmuC domain-containing protein n=1 Tax=Anisakis simplex TaxID=6269 RepID=A0A0M3KCV8_ANISI|nr:unnamed protein product [Anisakis simplex]